MQHRISKTISTLTGIAVFGIVIAGCQKELSTPLDNNLAIQTTQNNSKPGDPIPGTLQPPAGNKLMLTAYAKGVQIYQVQRSATDPNVIKWVFIAPSANLYLKSAFLRKIFFCGCLIFCNIVDCITMSKFIKKLNYTALKRPTLAVLLSFLFTLIITKTYTQDIPLKIKNTPKQKGELKILHRCSTMEVMEEAIRKDPTLPEKWRVEGERQYQLYLQRQQQNNLRVASTAANPIIIPVVFHLVDAAATLNGISDRDIIEQVEILNRDYGGNKLSLYTSVIPPRNCGKSWQRSSEICIGKKRPNWCADNRYRAKSKCYARSYQH